MEVRWNIYRNLKQHVRTTSVLFTGQDPEFKTLANFLPVVGNIDASPYTGTSNLKYSKYWKGNKSKALFKKDPYLFERFLYGMAKRFLPVFVSVVSAVSQNCGL